jgi:formyl-CoA transferase
MKPLQGVTVVNAARLAPGAYCSMLLADLGAEVIMIEHPVGGDPMRLRSPGFFHYVNKGKKSICIDLSQREGKQLCYDIAATSDVFIEGFRPGKAAKLGIDYNTLTNYNKKIIYTSISGFGQTGPYRNMAAHDINYQALAGMFFKQIKEDNISFSAPVVPASDLASAMFAAIAIMGGLIHKQYKNSGTYIDISMYDAMLSWMSIWLTGPANTDPPQEDEPCYNIFKTKDNRYIALGIAYEDHFWERFCKAIDDEPLSRIKHDERLLRFEELKERLEGIFLLKSQKQWIELMNSYDVPISPAYQSMDEIAMDGHLKELGLLRDGKEYRYLENLRIGTISQEYGPDPTNDLRAPLTGEHTEEILRKLGYDRQRVDALKVNGVII